MGTGSLTLNSLRQVLPQVFPSEGKLLCLVGSPAIETEEQIGGVRFQHYVPAEEVMPYCDWVICHGGQNTIAQSLLNGVPLIIFPGPIFERRFNAMKAQEAGAGWKLEKGQFNKEALEKLLPTQVERAACAVTLGRRIRSYRGPEGAIRAIQERV